MEFLTDLGLLWTYILGVPCSHIVLDCGFLYVRQVDLEHLSWVPASMVQVKEAHLIYAGVPQEDLQWAQVSMDQLLLMKHGCQIDNF